MATSLSTRLKQARSRAGFADATAAARHFGWTIPTYLAHENGSRGFGFQLAQTYAAAFKVDEAWLVTGRGRRSPGDKASIAGYIGAGGIIYSMEDIKGFGTIEAVDLPPGMYDGFAIFKMRGVFYYPAYRDNELVFARKDAGPPTEHLRRDCVVRTDDRRAFLRTISSISEDGRFTLLGFNDTAPLEIGLEWAWPVEWTRRP
jgi:hypothetical protein